MYGNEVYPCATCIPLYKNLHFLYPFYFGLCLMRTELLASVKFWLLRKNPYELSGNFIYLKRRSRAVIFKHFFFHVYILSRYL